jgi:hypothetical protein
MTLTISEIGSEIVSTTINGTETSVIKYIYNVSAQFTDPLGNPRPDETVSFTAESYNENVKDITFEPSSAVTDRDGTARTIMSIFILDPTVAGRDLNAVAIVCVKSKWDAKDCETVSIYVEEEVVKETAEETQ